MQLNFKMLTLRQIVPQIRSEDWFVTIDLKDAYFYISIFLYHRKFLRFAFGGRAYQSRVLPFGQALSPRTLRRCDPGASSFPRYSQNELHRRLVNSSSVASFGSSASRCHSCPHERVARPITYCQTVLETVRSYVSSIQRDTFWIVVHETHVSVHRFTLLNEL